MQTLPGAAVTDQTFNPTMFLCEQAVLTNNLLTSISNSLTMIVNHLTGNIEIGQCNSTVTEAIDLTKPESTDEMSA